MYAIAMQELHQSVYPEGPFVALVAPVALVALVIHLEVASGTIVVNGSRR
jgi:hypothetical protein